MPNHEFIALTDEELASLESTFKLRLPEFHRRFCQSYPQRLTELRVEGGETIAEEDLVASYAALVELNTGVRDPNLWYFGEHPWPTHFFVIGTDGYGDHYFLDTSGEYPGVRFQDINSWDIGLVADTLDNFVAYLEGNSDASDEA